MSLGKAFGRVVRCLNVQWTSLVPGQLQLRGQDGMACVGETYREETGCAYILLLLFTAVLPALSH